MNEGDLIDQWVDEGSSDSFDDWFARQRTSDGRRLTVYIDGTVRPVDDDDDFAIGKPAAASLPEDLSKVKDEELLASARTELAGSEKITFAQAKALGGPSNPRVAEMIRRGLVNGVAVPQSADERLLAHPATRDRALKIKADLEAKAQAAEREQQQKVERARVESAKKKISFEDARKMGGLSNPEIREMVKKGLVEGVAAPRSA